MLLGVGRRLALGLRGSCCATPLLQALPRQASGGAPARIITKAELEKHNTEDDCWIVIKGRVYDVSDYVYEHPGGEIIAAGAGTDSTAEFDKAEHSDAAIAEMRKFYIGDFKP